MHPFALVILLGFVAVGYIIFGCIFLLGQFLGLVPERPMKKEKPMSVFEVTTEEHSSGWPNGQSEVVGRRTKIVEAPTADACLKKWPGSTVREVFDVDPKTLEWHLGPDGHVVRPPKPKTDE